MLNRYKGQQDKTLFMRRLYKPLLALRFSELTQTQTCNEFKLAGYFLKFTISEFPDNMSWEELTIPDQWRLQRIPWSPQMFPIASRAAAEQHRALPNRAFYLS